MRKARAKKRLLLPDPKFGDKMVTRFVNCIMFSGNKERAFRIFYDALELIEKNDKINDPPLEVWKTSLNNIMPQVEVRSRRIGGATFQIPMPIRPDRKISMGMSWMIRFARKRSGKSMADKLSNEIIAAFNEEGGAYKKKTEVHKMAESNKAFSHFKI
tara:strand:- start:122 stop:595 length:474 start_codon:yes stop_codon:yes gene_type:complete